MQEKVILWINGAFGVGKTQTSFALQRRIKKAFVFDPENAGYYIRKNMPPEAITADFQDTPIWREINYRMLLHIRNSYEGIIIVPMTITNKQYYNEIIGRLQKDGVYIKHFILYAEKETILKRLRKRYESKNSWAVKQINRCIYAFDHDITKEKIMTENKTVDKVAEEIAQRSGITLKPDNRSGFEKFAERVLTQIRHIRI